MLNVYLVRHGKTMFNTIHRTQGWSDTPLTAKGELGIKELGLGFKEAGIHFDAAYSSDSGRAIQTCGLILKYAENEGIPYRWDKRIREWCFGSFDGGYEGELFDGVLPRIFAEKGEDKGIRSYQEIAEAIQEVDTAGWAEPWETISGRIMTGFTDLAESSLKQGAKNIVIVSHGMTIATFCKLLRPEMPRVTGLDNGCVTHLKFTDEQFELGKIGDMSYRELGRKKIEG